MGRVGTTSIGIVGALLLVLAHGANAAVCLSDERPHACNSIESCRSAVQRNALDGAARLALCDLQVEQGRLDDAAALLQDGLRLCGVERDTRLCRTLQLAFSNVEERRRAAVTGGGSKAGELDPDVARGYCLGPIVNERTVAACRSLLVTRQDPELYAALSRKLLGQGLPARALAEVARATALNVSSAELEAVRSEAAARRAVAVRTCVEQLQASACDAAFLEGADDAPAILRARAQILRDRDADGALAALSAAFELTQDRTTAALIVDLDERRYAPSDLSFRTLRSQAFRVLGRLDAEAAELEVVVRLDPGARDFRSRLTAVRSEIAARDQPPVRPVTSLTGAASTAAPTAATSEPSPTPAVSPAPTAPVFTTATPQIPSPPITYLNQISDGGRIH